MRVHLSSSPRPRAMPSAHLEVANSSPAWTATRVFAAFLVLRCLETLQYLRQGHLIGRSRLLALPVSSGPSENRSVCRPFSNDASITFTSPHEPSHSTVLRTHGDQVRRAEKPAHVDDRSRSRPLLLRLCRIDQYAHAFGRSSATECLSDGRARVAEIAHATRPRENPPYRRSTVPARACGSTPTRNTRASSRTAQLCVRAAQDIQLGKFSLPRLMLSA